MISLSVPSEFLTLREQNETLLESAEWHSEHFLRSVQSETLNNPWGHGVRLWTLLECAEWDSDYFSLSAHSETLITPWVRRVRLWALPGWAERDSDYLSEQIMTLTTHLVVQSETLKSEHFLNAQSETLNTPWVCRVRLWTLPECAKWDSRQRLWSLI